ncbi:hypothetical protein Zmor_026850 [Zophobas morio]|uniref:Uncharacterized protein n=1 Tax=Zophobas morio TaxID=2755281 RepID=A0AA38HVA2_9CUCU|nr:hypothetical protein Zmor_026850 [Zophobas morio]
MFLIKLHGTELPLHCLFSIRKPFFQTRIISPAFSTASYGHTSPLRSDDSSESDVLSAKNLKDTVDFSGSSLRPTWETTQPGTVVDHNSDGKTRKFATILTTTPLSTRNFGGSVAQGMGFPITLILLS